PRPSSSSCARLRSTAETRESRTTSSRCSPGSESIGAEGDPTLRFVAAWLVAFALTASAQTPAPEVRMTESYVRTVARDAYFWAWPMLNVNSRRLAFKDRQEPGLMGGIVPVAPPNRLAMLSDYILPEERVVACPNQDVVYGFGVLALDESPVVVQVPD